MPLRASAANPPSSGRTSRSSIRIGCALVSARWSGCGRSASVRWAGSRTPSASSTVHTDWASSRTSTTSALNRTTDRSRSAHRVDDLAQVERRREGLRERVQRDEQLVGGGHLGGLVDRGRLVRLDLGDQVAGERAERAAQQEHDRDLAGRPLVGGVDRLHRDRGRRRRCTRRSRSRPRPAGPTRSRRAAGR